MVAESETEVKDTAKGKIVFIHGLWMTPLCWEHFNGYFHEKGYDVMAPAWPGHEGGAEEIRENAATTLAGLGLAEIIEHYKKILLDLDELPILIGHSFGGLLVQILLDKGLAAAGVAIDSAPPKGVHTITFAELKSAFPVLSKLSNRHEAVGLNFEQFKYSFANTMSKEEARYAYDRYAIPDTGKVLFENISDDFKSDSPDTVDYNNNTRGPLLLIAGSEDHTVPAKVTKSNYGKYKHSSSVTDFKEFSGRSHSIIFQDGWQEVADYIQGWLIEKIHY